MKGNLALTRDEVVGLMDGLLTSREPPTGTTRLGDWLAKNGEHLGWTYASELRRNWRLYKQGEREKRCRFLNLPLEGGAITRLERTL